MTGTGTGTEAGSETGTGTGHGNGNDGAAGRPLPAAPYPTRPRLRSKRGRELFSSTPSYRASAATFSPAGAFSSAFTAPLLRATSLMKIVTTKASSANGAE